MSVPSIEITGEAQEVAKRGSTGLELTRITSLSYNIRLFGVSKSHQLGVNVPPAWRSVCSRGDLRDKHEWRMESPGDTLCLTQVHKAFRRLGRPHRKRTESTASRR